MTQANGHHRVQTAIDIKKPPVSFTGGLVFECLTYTVRKDTKVEGKWSREEVNLLHDITSYAPKGCITAVMGPSGAGKSTLLDGLAGRIASGSLKGRVSLDGATVTASLIKRTSAYIMQEDRLFPMLTVYETLMFAADFRLGPLSFADKKQRVEKLIDQLGLRSSRNTYIGDEGTRGVSGGERRRVSIGVDIIHGPSLLFLDEPTSGLDSTSAHSVIEKVHDIARSGSTVILTIHQPSSRIQLLLDHLIILARGQLMFQGSPQDVTIHLSRMPRKVPKGENPIEHLIDVIQEYDQSEVGVEALAEFARTGVKPPPLSHQQQSLSSIAPSAPFSHHGNRFEEKSMEFSHSSQVSRRLLDDFDHSLRSPYNNTSMSWSTGNSAAFLKFTPSRLKNDHKLPNSTRNDASPGYYTYSSEILQATPTPHSSDYTVNENDYLTPSNGRQVQLGPKFSNSYLTEIWILIRRNFINIRRTPELFLSRLMVLTFMGFMMATMFHNPKQDLQGITNRLSFFIFTVCLFFFSSNDAVPAFIQERFIFIRETSHNAYRASTYTIAGIITHMPFILLQAATYAVIVWFALKLRGPFLYFLLILFVSLLSTNSFVVFVSSVVPNYILGYAMVIAFTALFFLFCGYFLNSHDIPRYWRWMNIISTMTYPYEGLLMNQYQISDPFGFIDGKPITGFQILDSLHIKTDGRRKRTVVLIILWESDELPNLVLIIFLRSASGSTTEGFENIACCADSNYTDTQTTLNYQTDYTWFPDKGTCRRTKFELNQKVRLFLIDEGKRCYNLPTTKNKVYLIRGTFPFDSVTSSSFNVLIGVTQLGAVKPSTTQDLEIEIEGVFRANKDYIDFCLVKGEADPFISQLELRPLPEEYLLHDLPPSVLKLISRNSLWGTKDEIRFPTDPSDRMWKPTSSPSSALLLSYNVSNFDIKSNMTPPLQVLQTALTHPDRLEIHSNLETEDYEYLVFLYFLELNSTVKEGKRVFDIYVNSDIKKKKFDILAGGSNYTYTVLNVSANGLLNLTLVKASGAEFGPLLNAYEILQMRTWIEETNQKDGIFPRDNLGLCFMHGCNYLVMRRNLSHNNFNGYIPSFPASSLLISIDLSYNDLIGSLPKSIVSLPYLKSLYFGCNKHMSKDTPANLNSSLINTDYGRCKAKDPRFGQVFVIGAITCGTLLIVLAVGIIFVCRYRQKLIPWEGFGGKNFLMETNVIFSLPSKDDFLIKSVSIQTFTLEDIEVATESYKTLIGEGGFGSVYRGTLNDSQEVAVKVRSATSTQGTREFDNELNLLSAIQHENLVPLLGYCNENDQQILVYPFMSNGSLQDRLYGEPAKRKILDWPTRLSIALGAARGNVHGLAYLHTFPGRSVIHRDVKSSNILLDHSMCAKVADFGFSKYAPQEGDSNVSLEVRGTAGYLDPEYYTTQQLSEKSDVFSFGVVLLEIVSGREPLDIKRPRNEWSLVEWAKPYIRASKVDEIVDPGIKGGYHAEAMWRVVEVALQCLEPFSAYRPSMVDIVRELEDALIIENNASEYMKSIDSLGGSNRYSIVIEKRVLPSTSSTAESTITTQALSHPQPR
ncbi:unnamed protein product [Sphenostylis stenocarpa]|uniref:ABC transporter G family member STR2 n=1 Tax=Sphenostylis stenocarpa TaxID=92480 RepID=A0AA86S1M2_9FABA|nr:unnamed protein product [Sphenostylis stenocarpa]